MKQSRSSWYIHVSFIVVAAVLSFVLHQAPYVFSSMPYSIGADGDSAFHFAIQMKLRDPTLFPKDVELNEMYLSSRPAFEFAIHRAVIWLADHLFRGNLFVANSATFWCYHLVFLAGCYLLGLSVLRSSGGAALFSMASIGPSRAFNAWWGMAYGAVIPKYVGLAFVPWFLLGYLSWFQRPQRLVALFFALGLVVNVYPLLPLYLGLILLAVTLCRPKPPWRLCAVMGVAFSGAALPSVLALATGVFERAGTLNAQGRVILETLLRRHYDYALLNLKHAAVSLVSPVWFILAIAGVGFILKRRQAGLDEAERPLFLRLSGWAVIVGLLGVAANLANRLYLSLAHTSLVLVCGVGAVLWAVRTRLLGKWNMGLNTAEGQLLAVTAWTMVLSLAGFFVGAVYRPLLAFLFHRASVFLYVPAYLGCAWLAMDWMRRRAALGTALGVGVVLVMVLNGAMNTALFDRIRGAPIAQTSAPYYALSDWAARNTTASSLFMVPYGQHAEPFFAFRVYSARGVLLHWVAGEMVISNPRLVAQFWQMSQDVEPLYAQASDTADFVRVALKYRVDYIVTDRTTPRPPDLPVAYHNEGYTVFVVPPE